MSENVQQKKQLTPRQLRAVDALLSGATYQDAAKSAGVTDKTLSRWRKQPAFDDELRRRGTVAVSDASRRLTGTLDNAVDVLREVMNDEEAPQSVRIRAARYILDAATKLLELSEVMERLEALEQVVANVRR